jgi:AcrR family transcriptional regulator
MSRDRIIDAARTMVESSGIDELTMRKLAAELGVAPTTIYWHVGDREAVLDALVDEVVAESSAIEPSGRTPTSRISSVVRQMRNQVQGHPNLIQLANQRGRGPAVSFPAQLVLARELTAAGLAGAEAARSAWALLHLVGGSILLDGVLQDYRGRTRGASALWEDVDDPGIDRRLAKRMADRPRADEVFEYQLTLLVRGLLGERSHP